MSRRTAAPEPATGERPSAAAPESTGETAARLRLAVGRLARRLRRQDEHGLPLTQSAAIATLFRRGPMTLGELATAEQVAPPTMTRVVGILEEQGLVRRSVDPDDRRVVRVELSAKGRRRLDSDRERRAAYLAGRLDELTPDERARLVGALDVLERLAGVGEPTGAVPVVGESS